MKQFTTILVAVFVIVYLTLSIYSKPNYEFFFVDNNIPIEPKFVRGDFINGGINVQWTHPGNLSNITHYEIYIEDIRDNKIKIPNFIVNDQKNSQNPKFMVRNQFIRPDRQYRVSMKSVNSNGKSVISNKAVTSISRNTSQNTSLSTGTVQTLDKDTERFKQHESEQNLQNRAISELKKRVDALRNDIVILKNKEKEENQSIHNKVEMEDTISQLPGSVRDRFGLNLPGEIDFNFTIDPTL